MTLARKRLGEEHWIQGRMMAGHVPMTVSDIYALPEPANLGRVLAISAVRTAQLVRRFRADPAALVHWLRAKHAVTPKAADAHPQPDNKHG